MSMEKRHPLGVLIRNTRTVNGWSQDEVGRRAKGFGIKLSGSAVSAMENEPVNSVSVKQVESLARVLDLPERLVLSAFLASMGYAPERSSEPDVEAAIRADGRLSSDDRQLLLTMVAKMTERRAPVIGISSRRPIDDGVYVTEAAAEGDPTEGLEDGPDEPL